MSNGKRNQKEHTERSDEQVSPVELQRQREAVIRKLVEIRRKRGDRQKEPPTGKEES